ncbi:MAG: hypothetical protein AAGJ38_03075 [Planctomycetota bacterium]
MKPETKESIQLDASPPRSRWPKRCLKLGVWAVALVVLFTAAAPWLLSTGLGNQLVLRVVNGQIPGTFTADRVGVGWFGGVGVTGGVLRDPDGGVVVDDLNVTADTLGIVDVLGGSGFGDVVVTLGEVTVEQPAEGPSNLHRALGLGASTEPGTADEADASTDGASGVSLPVDLGVSTKLTAARVSYTTIAADGTRDQTTLADLAVEADLTDATRVTAKATGRLERDGVSGVLDANLALIDALDEAGVVDWRQGGVELEANVLELPVGPLDRLFELGGVLAASLGERLSVEVSASGTLAAPEASLAVTSPLLEMNASLRRQGDAVQIEPGAALTWRLTPEAFAAAQGDAAVAVLNEAVDWVVPVEVLRLPIEPNGVAIERASGRVEATWTPVSIAMADGRTVGMRGGALRVDTAAVGDRVSLVFATDASVTSVGSSDPIREDRVLLTMALLDLQPDDETAPGVGFDMELERLPVSLIEALAAVEVPGGGLPQWLGPEVSLDAEVRLARESGGPVSASGRVRSAGVNGPFALSIQPDGMAGQIETPEPITLRLQRDVLLDAIGPEAWFGLPVGLRESIEPSLALRGVRWRLSPPKATDEEAEDPEATPPGWEVFLARLDPQQTSGQVELTLPSLKLQDHQRERALPELRGVRASVAVTELSRPIETVIGMNFDGPELPESPDKEVDGGVTIRVTASELMDPSGVFAPQRGAFDLNLRGTAVPSAVVDAFAGQEGRLAATLGPSIEPELSVKVRAGRDASLEMDVVSTNAVGSVLLTEDLSDDVWRPELQEDPRFTLAVSREAVESWMGRLHPILADVVRSAPDAPAKLSLDRSTFALSEEGFFDLEGIRAQATLDLGRLELERQGWLRQGITGVVRQFVPNFRRDRAGSTYVASFSPMRINVEDGIVQTSELWLSADDMGVGFAGSIDLNNNRIEMGLGVMGATFIAAGSDFEKVLEPLRVYELPVRGTIAEPEIQYDRFLGQVAAAYGQRELQRNADKLGEWGVLIGVLGQAVVTDVFQWENTRAWTPSGDAEAFAVGIANPEPAEETAADTPADGDGAQAPPEEPTPEPEPEDEVEEVLKGILDIIGRQRDR